MADLTSKQRQQHNDIPRWPNALKGEMTINGKTVPVHVQIEHLGYGWWPNSPADLEFRQILLVFEQGDARAFRYTLRGVPFDGHVLPPPRHPHFMLNQGNIALLIHSVLVHWREDLSTFYEEIQLEGDKGPTR